MSALIKPFSRLSVRASSSVSVPAFPAAVLPVLSRNASSSVASSSASSSSSSSTSLSDISLSSVVPHTSIPRRSDFPATYPGPSHKHINQPKFLDAPPESQFPARIGENEEGRREDVSLAITGMRKEEMRGLRRYTVVLKRVVKMTKKGKMPSFMAMLVVGSPERGLVGIGRGRGNTTIRAMDAGFHKAVQSLDFVNKYEGRTLWSSSGDDISSRFGATTVILRARPAGFGLMVPPVIHRVLTAAGIKDCSATIEGSRNPMQVLKATIQLLHSGTNPPGFGSGTGSKGRREDKGQGLRTKDDIERERGRYGIDIGQRL